MPNTNDIKRYLSTAGHGLATLDVIGQAATAFLGLGNDKTVVGAETLLHAILAAIKSVQGGIDGSVPIETAEQSLLVFQGAIASNDAAAQDSLDSKFPTGSLPP
jgi:hypothetical protein